MSKNSVRNCSRAASLIFVVLITEKSTLLNPGPITTLRPRLPKTGGPAHPAPGAQNADLLNQAAGSGFERRQSPATFARRVARPVGPAPETMMFTGLPDCNVTMPDSDQPSINRFPLNGKS